MHQKSNRPIRDADGAGCPVRVWKAVPVSYRPKAVSATGIYPPGQRHKPARFHVLYGSSGSGRCWNSTSGTPAPSAPANPALPHSRSAPYSAKYEAEQRELEEKQTSRKSIPANKAKAILTASPRLSVNMRR